jgi:hypothetical protein
MPTTPSCERSGHRRDRRTRLRHAGPARLGPRHPGRKSARHHARRHRPQRPSRRPSRPQALQEREERHPRRHPFFARQDPEIEVTQVRMQRDGRTEIVLEHYQPAPYLLNLLEERVRANGGSALPKRLDTPPAPAPSPPPYAASPRTRAPEPNPP